MPLVPSASRTRLISCLRSISTAAAAHAGVIAPVGPFRAQLAPPGFTFPAAARAQIAARIEQRRIERRREP